MAPIDSRQLPTQDLLRHAAAGNDAAWTDLYGKYRLLLQMAAQTMLSHQYPKRSSAEDVVQQAFVAAWEKIQQFEYQGEGSFRRWLTTIVVNEARGLLRREQAERRNLPREPGTPSTAMGGVACSEVDQPSQAFGAKEDREQFLRTLEALPENELEIVYLRTFKRLGWAEVAERSGFTEWVARSTYSQALKTMSRAMQGPASSATS